MWSSLEDAKKLSSFEFSRSLVELGVKLRQPTEEILFCCSGVLLISAHLLYSKGSSNSDKTFWCWACCLTWSALTPHFHSLLIE
jgi:hypothetical protein